MHKWVETLHPLEVRVIRAFDSAVELSASVLVEKLAYSVGQANQALSWMFAKGLLEEGRRESIRCYELTEKGREWLEKDPALAFRELVSKDQLDLIQVKEILNIDQAIAGKIFGQYSKEGVLSLDKDKKIILRDTKHSYWDILHSLLEEARTKPNNSLNLSMRPFSELELRVLEGESKKRSASMALFKLIDKQVLYYKFDLPLLVIARKYINEKRLTGEEVGPLTTAMLKDGSWKGKYFRPYSLQVPITRLVIGRRNAYVEYLESVKDELVKRGFKEFDGPIVETEFWNNDALFMPQFHAARDIHDVYYVKEPTKAKYIEEPYLSRVAKAHEEGYGCGSLGWRYPFDREFTRRLILRSQGTVLSAKNLRKTSSPNKFFGIVRCFRYDQVDATHGADFYQTEGIVLDKQVNVKTLLGLLEVFAKDLTGAKEVKYVPAYFPFTEPSFEVHVKHPQLGWFELGGAGLLRPEVTIPLGVDTPVMAWGLGIDRMALLHLGLNDLRELFTSDLDSVRLRRANYAEN